MAKLLTLNRNHFLYLLVTIFILIVIFYICFGPQIYSTYYQSYLEESVAPKMAKLFGFTAEWKSIKTSADMGNCGKSDFYVVTSITPDGPLARMGFEIGDVPFEYHGGFTALYRALQKACNGKSSSIEVFKLADAEKGKYIKREIFISPFEPNEIKRQ